MRFCGVKIRPVYITSNFGSHVSIIRVSELEDYAEFELKTQTLSKSE